MSSAPDALSISVVICCYTERRWTELSEAARAVAGQLGPRDELLVVVDHNPELLDRVRAGLPGQAVANEHGRGLSGARNTGVAHARGSIVAFLDDDALPDPGWVQGWRRSFGPFDVVAVGGAVHAAWEGGARPRWFPTEFGWVVGCDYDGLPGTGAPIRNPIGASMAVRREPLVAVGGFSELVGRVGALPVGCEETELGIKLTAADPAARIVRDDSAPVAHLVPKDRQRLSYLVRRCYHEGRSKRQLSALVGRQAGLQSERRYVTQVLPMGVLRHLVAALRGDAAGVARAAVIVVGLAATCVGYLSARPVAAAVAGATVAPRPLS